MSTRLVCSIPNFDFLSCMKSIGKTEIFQILKPNKSTVRATLVNGQSSVLQHIRVPVKVPSSDFWDLHSSIYMILSKVIKITNSQISEKSYFNNGESIIKAVCPLFFPFWSLRETRVGNLWTTWADRGPTTSPVKDYDAQEFKMSMCVSLNVLQFKCKVCVWTMVHTLTFGNKIIWC